MKPLLLHHANRNHRRGAAYFVVLATSILVSGMALSALFAVRMQNVKIDNHIDILNATNNAIDGIDSALLQVKTNATWRTDLNSNTWSSDRTVASGTYNFTGVDPLDNNLTNSTVEPVAFTATGKAGNAQHSTSAKLDAYTLPIDSARVAIAAADDVEFYGGTTTIDNWAVANDAIKTGNSSTTTADVAGAGNISTTGITGTASSATTWPRTMPNNNSFSSNYAFTTYNSAGTTINQAGLPQSNSELLSNTSFNSDTSGWAIYGLCLGARSTGNYVSAPGSYLIQVRLNANTGAYQDVTSDLINGCVFTAATQLRPTSNTNARFDLVVTSSGSGTQTFTSATTSCTGGTWNPVSINLTPTWTGTLTSAVLRVTTDTTASFYVDDISFKASGLASNTLYIINNVLTETYNPYGSGTVNASGIYLIDCANKNIIIRNSRIRGTLVLTNAQSVTVDNSVNWEYVVAGYPAIMTTADLTISPSSSTLNEATIGVNLNPAIAPYGGASNTTATDTYPSKITGIIYSTNYIYFGGNANILGSIISQDDVTIQGTSLTVNYWEEILKNPPPGFRNTSPTQVLIPSSFKSVVSP